MIRTFLVSFLLTLFGLPYLAAAIVAVAVWVR